MMQIKEFISPKQFLFLIYVFCIGSAILAVPATLLETNRQNAWFCGVLTMGFALLIVAVLLWLIQRYPQQTFIQIAKKALGPYTGTCISLIYIFFMFIQSTFSLRDISTFMTTQIVPETLPTWIHALVLLAVIYGGYLGIEVIARTAEIFLPWIIVPFLLLIVLNIPQVKIDRLYPLFEFRMDDLVLGTTYFLGNPFMELVFVLMITPHIKDGKKVKRMFVMGTVASGLTIIIAVAACILALGANIASMHSYPVYLLGKMISLGATIQHVEVLVAIIWMLSIFFKVVIVFYAIQLSIVQLCNLRVRNFLSFPLGLIITGVAYYIIPNTAYFNYFEKYYWSFYLFVLSLCFPLLFIALSYIKKNKAAKGDKNQQI
ncbi:GerAB/ArcD/ProY family transporter [Priestia aryabhattai]|uniref:GerAB/ArcD/ProY family transporter n=1 Tax=Priestia aryabhattai TaxID=412384 RepID=UPI0024534A0F|nr:endospore germination permease [Priestia aryabhattai]MDH3115718.1 endospore germination permease [Priestia aryabhattai]MDH3125389.1 endospore germination permease [Priestia aryabhattai]